MYNLKHMSYNRILQIYKGAQKIKNPSNLDVALGTNAEIINGVEYILRGKQICVQLNIPNFKIFLFLFSSTFLFLTKFTSKYNNYCKK